jgi:hypothetical protein
MLVGAEFDELVEHPRPGAQGVDQNARRPNRRWAQPVQGLPGRGPHYELAKINGSVAQYVWDINYSRRHLTTGGRAIAAANLKVEAAREAMECQRTAGSDKCKRPKALEENLPQAPRGKARDVAGAKCGVSGKTAEFAEKVKKYGADEVIKAVQSGELSVSLAAKLVDGIPKDVQREALARGPR